MKNVAIDWSLYKGEDNGRGKKGFISFSKCLNENGWTLKSDYIKNSEKVTIVCKNCHEFLIKPNTLLNKKHKDCKECRKATKEKPKKEVIKFKKTSSICKKIAPKHFENFDKKIKYNTCTAKIFFEIDNNFPNNYNTVLGIPQKSVDLKEELRRSRLLGQISKMDDLLELSKVENN